MEERSRRCDAQAARCDLKLSDLDGLLAPQHALERLDVDKINEADIERLVGNTVAAV